MALCRKDRAQHQCIDVRTLRFAHRPKIVHGKGKGPMGPALPDALGAMRQMFGQVHAVGFQMPRKFFIARDEKKTPLVFCNDLALFRQARSIRAFIVAKHNAAAFR